MMISEIITRLSKLDAPDREADALIGKHFLPDEAKSFFDFNAPSYTASVDAVIALAERVLPGQARKIVWEEGRAIVVISQATRLHEVAPTIVQTHDHAAIALCIALLRAKEASK
ncbi:hypothetical protein [Brucella anthropi]|uniref:hypothetical protein n=1 Tax=Brucella anthropi TaxID=529 RepID=UPI0005BAD45E|nr:hypothetical protein [Brucella anthropi]KIU68402.1 hypothetical protein TR92_11035 [Brucella anthropi]